MTHVTMIINDEHVTENKNILSIIIRTNRRLVKGLAVVQDIFLFFITGIGLANREKIFPSRNVYF